jgi:uncharacterized protein (DUF427 family)
VWTYRGQKRPEFAVEPMPGQESVWDYPRPPRIEPDSREVLVMDRNREIARTLRAFRVLETASPPTFYIPPEDTDMGLLVPARGSSFCEWKGKAIYWALASGEPRVAVGWSYPEPTQPFRAIRDHLSFYPARVECHVAGERVRPQPGAFYGGWITSEIVGPFKGEPGTEGW